MSDRAPCCCMMLCVRADGVETAGHRGAPVPSQIGSAGSLPEPARAEAEEAPCSKRPLRCAESLVAKFARQARKAVYARTVSTPLAPVQGSANGRRGPRRRIQVSGYTRY